jgi:folate-binding protein YgfZ
MTTGTTATVADERLKTPLACVLAGTGLRMSAFRGVQTVAALADEATEMAAALDGAAVHDLGWQRRVAVTGEDRMRWLNGMVTNNVAGLNATEAGRGAGNYNLVLNAQGRIQGDCRVWRTGDDREERLELEIAADQFAALTGHLERFIIMDDVELKPLVGWTALGVTGPKAGDVLTALVLDVSSLAVSRLDAMPEGTSVEARLSTVADAEIPLLVRREGGWSGTGRRSDHWALWCREEDAAALWSALQRVGATAVGCETVERLRILEGVPVFGVDFAGDVLPQETAIEDALHFAKGCYLGQEIVERIRSRGQVHRHLRMLEIFPDGQEPTVGLELSWEPGRADGDAKSAAKLTSVTSLEMDGVRRWFAMGMVRVGSRELETGELKYAGGRARIVKSALARTRQPN